MKASKNANKKPLIIGSAITATLAIVILILIILFNNNIISGGLNSAFFTSSGNKYVITLTGSDIFPEADKDYIPVKIHRVYTTSNGVADGLKIYQEYESGRIARQAYEQIRELDRDVYQAIDLDAPYVILTAKPFEYEGITVDDLKVETTSSNQLDE